LLTENKNANNWWTVIEVRQSNIDTKCRNGKLHFVKKYVAYYYSCT